MKRVEIEQPAGRRRAVLGDDAVEAVVAEDLGVRIDERALELDGAAQLADVGQIGTQSRAAAVDAVARRARALAVEQRLAAIERRRRPDALRLAAATERR